MELREFVVQAACCKRLGFIITEEIEWGSESLVRHLAVRDYLRVHLEQAAKCGGLKTSLAEQFRHDNDGYYDGKYDFVQSLELRALDWVNNVSV